MTKKECTLEAQVLVNLDHGSAPFDIFQTVTGMNERQESLSRKRSDTLHKKVATLKQRRMKWRHSLGYTLLWVWISYHRWKTICQQTNVSEMNSFKMSWQEQGFSPSNRIFTFPITTMIIKLINRTKSVLSSNI